MKRVKAACICQTLQFSQNEDILPEYAEKMIKGMVSKYKKDLERKRVQYKVISEETQPDGSVILVIIKQYNACPVGHYLD